MNHSQTKRQIGELVFDSDFQCGNGFDFTETAPGCYRFRTRPEHGRYSWRFNFRILSPGDGRIITLEAADFNHAGRELWQEAAAVWTADGKTWNEIGLDNTEIVSWTPEEGDVPYGDESHIPYGVRYRVALTSRCMQFAVPAPCTPEDRDKLLDGFLAAHPACCRELPSAESYHSSETGVKIRGIQITDFSVPDEKKKSVVVIAGEHPAEVAGMYACVAMMEKMIISPELQREFNFFFVPMVNVDGICMGRSYHNTAPDGEPAGYNISLDFNEMHHPETRYVCSLVEKAKPCCFVRLHNGRHWKEYRIFTEPEMMTSSLIDSIKESMTIPVGEVKPTRNGDLFIHRRYHLPASMTFETLLLRKHPACDNWIDSYKRTGLEFLTGLTNGLRKI